MPPTECVSIRVGWNDGHSPEIICARLSSILRTRRRDHFCKTAGKRSDIVSGDFIQYAQEPRSLGVCRRQAAARGSRLADLKIAIAHAVSGPNRNAPSAGGSGFPASSSVLFLRRCFFDLRDSSRRACRWETLRLYSWDLTSSVPEPRSLGVCIGVRLLLRILFLRR